MPAQGHERRAPPRVRRGHAEAGKLVIDDAPSLGRGRLAIDPPGQGHALEIDEIIEIGVVEPG